jgi:excisionase family DNA binding protein
MLDSMSVSEAAEALNLSPARVRAMASRGQLQAVKLADRWLVERRAVEKRLRRESPRGRRFTPRNAWALLMIASGEDVPGLDPSARSRLRRAVVLEGLANLEPRLRDRSRISTYRAHPGEIRHLIDDDTFVPSGITAASAVGADLLTGREADGYIAQSHLEAFIHEHALSPAGDEGNVRLRIIPDEIWTDLKGRPAAPPAVVALDLAEELDPRSEAAGKKLVRQIDRRNRARKQGG